MYLIHGVFFQNYTGLGIAMQPIEGAVAVIQTRLAQHWMFQGVIGKDPADPQGPWTGEIHDQFGESFLSDIALDETEVRFTKNYEHRSDPIRYSFTRNSQGIWEGQYVGEPSVGSGFTRCVFVEVLDDFLIPPPEALEKARKDYEDSCRRDAEALVASAKETPKRKKGKKNIKSKKRTSSR